MSSIQDIINLLYLKHKKSYLSSYGSDILFSIIIIYIYSVAITYYYVKNHLPQLRKNWPKDRCNPLYMPFASLVLKNNKDSANKVIEDNFNGLFYENGAYELAEKMLYLIENKDIRLKLARNGRKVFNKKYTSEIYAEKFLGLLRE